jgi:hypothetical protein
MKNQQKGFIVPLLVLIIAVLAIGGGAYVYTQNKEATQTPVSTTPTSTTTTSTHSPSASSSSTVKAKVNSTTPTPTNSVEPSLTLTNPVPPTSSAKISLMFGDSISVSWTSSHLKENGVQNIGIYLKATNGELCQLSVVPIDAPSTSVTIPTVCKGTNKKLVPDIYKLVIYGANDLSSSVGMDTTHGSLISVLENTTLPVNQQTYTDLQHGFTIKYTYPTTVPGAWSLGSANKGTPLVSVPVKTVGYGSGNVEVGLSTNPTDIANCVIVPANTERTFTAKGNTTIGSMIFSHFSSYSPALGQERTTDSYRIMHNSACWNINVNLDGTESNRLTATQVAQKVSDYAAVNAELNSTLQSFSFTK